MGQNKHNEPDCDTILGIIQLAQSPLSIAQVMQQASTLSRPKVSTVLRSLLDSGLIEKTADNPPSFFPAIRQVDHTLKASAYQVVGDFSLAGRRVNPEAILALLQLAPSPLSLGDILENTNLTQPMLIRQAVETLVVAGRVRAVEGETLRYVAIDLTRPNLKSRAVNVPLSQGQGATDMSVEPSIILGLLQLFPRPATVAEISDTSGIEPYIIEMKLRAMVSSKILLEMPGAQCRYTILKSSVPDYSDQALDYLDERGR